MVHRGFLLLVLTAGVFLETSATNICNVFNEKNKIQCFCIYDSKKSDDVRSADCHITDPKLNEADPQWSYFTKLRKAEKLIFSSHKEIPVRYIPTHGIKHLEHLVRIDVKYGNIKEINAYAFARLPTVEEINLSDNQITQLHSHAFAHHSMLTTINLDTNNIEEIKRDVFHDLPSLEKLFLTMNKISTIHDKAFSKLPALKELELDKNLIFSLNSESFIGLRSLLRLDLSRNILEVIGDHTFSPLVNLQYLNLEGNKIQMLDPLAFSGLTKLQHLSLALNKLSNINSIKVFEDLVSLTSLSLRGNNMKELKFELIRPILSQFYSYIGTLDFEENNFPCDCHLDWLMSLKNKTKNEGLKLSIENLKCYPSPELQAAWEKIIENENDGPVDKINKNKPVNEEYEYYDDTQLEGKLFYMDIRHLLNCTEHLTKSERDMAGNTHKNYEKVHVAVTDKLVSTNDFTDSSVAVFQPLATNKHIKSFQPIKRDNVLDLSIDDVADNQADEEQLRLFETEKNDTDNKMKAEKSTTVKISTVSANPIYDKELINNSYDENKEMASDEAVRDTRSRTRTQVEVPPDEITHFKNELNKSMEIVFDIKHDTRLIEANYNSMIQTQHNLLDLIKKQQYKFENLSILFIKLEKAHQLLEQRVNSLEWADKIKNIDTLRFENDIGPVSERINSLGDRNEEMRQRRFGRSRRVRKRYTVDRFLRKLKNGELNSRNNRRQMMEQRIVHPAKMRNLERRERYKKEQSLHFRYEDERY